jgi:hypothetical protein
MNREELLQVIDQAAEDGRAMLELTHLEMDSLPAEIGRLTQLDYRN